MSAESVVWKPAENGAELSCGPLHGRVEMDGRGVRLLVATWNGEPSDAFGAMVTAGPGPRPERIEVAESYVRGSDFVARYAKSADYPVAPQFYWRAGFHESLAAVQIEMWLSVQTDLLDSNPEVSLSSFALESRLFLANSLNADSFREWPDAGATSALDSSATKQVLFVFRNEWLGLSYAQLVHPSDFVAARVLAQDSRPWLVETTLFPEHLEKGVIRRARIGGWFLPVENDLAAAAQLARQFVAAELPLTA